MSHKERLGNVLLIGGGYVRLEECPLSLPGGPHVVASGDSGAATYEDLQPMCLDNLLACATNHRAELDQPCMLKEN